MDTAFRFPNIIHTLQVTGCHFDSQPPGWSYPRHHHHLFELLYCLEGEVLQEIHRESFTSRQGEWLLIKSGVPIKPRIWRADHMDTLMFILISMIRKFEAHYPRLTATFSSRKARTAI